MPYKIANGIKKYFAVRYEYQMSHERVYFRVKSQAIRFKNEFHWNDRKQKRTVRFVVCVFVSVSLRIKNQLAEAADSIYFGFYLLCVYVVKIDTRV